MASIQSIFAREILDSRGLPTVECSIWLDNGVYAVSSAPSGTSKGKYEALELRDTESSRMGGYGVLKAVSNINELIAPQLIGRDPTKQTDIDQIMVQLDGTPNKTKLGANAMIAVSQAAIKAGAYSVNMPVYYYLQQKYQLTDSLAIPTCVYNLIDGGSHGATNLDFQEFHIVPVSHMDFISSLEMAVVIRQKLEETLIAKGAIHSVGLDGGFAPNLYNNTDAFEIMIEAIKNSPYTFIQDLFFGVDISASDFFQAGKYSLKDKSQPYSPKELFEYYKNMRKLYHVFSIEDPFQEDDWDSWQAITAELGETSTIVGDNLLAGNKERVEKAIQLKACNSMLVKPNQLGTITETIEVIKIAKAAGWQISVSHRSGETNDDFIADFAVGVGANYAKFGPPNRGERIAKFNRLTQIYQDIKQMG
ncbi:phosphopyruvate hydratase [soil metagenome]